MAAVQRQQVEGQQAYGHLAQQFESRPALLRRAALQQGERWAAGFVDRDDLPVKDRLALADGGRYPGKFGERAEHVGAISGEDCDRVLDDDGRSLAVESPLDGVAAAAWRRTKCREHRPQRWVPCCCCLAATSRRYAAQSGQPRPRVTTR